MLRKRSQTQKSTYCTIPAMSSSKLFCAIRCQESGYTEQGSGWRGRRGLGRASNVRFLDLGCGHFIKVL